MEGEFYLTTGGIQDLYYLPKDVESIKTGLTWELSDKVVFRQHGGEKRCLFFDSIEMTDHFEPLGGEEL